MKKFHILLCLLAISAVTAASAYAQDAQRGYNRLSLLRDMMETQRANEAAKVSEESLGAFTKNQVRDSYSGRDMILYVPTHLPPQGQRKLLVALHGGGGNPQFMLDHLKIDGVAEKNGFIVAYLSGSNAATMGNRMKAWDAGKGCCGQPYANKVDDVGYLTGAIHYLQQKYGIDPANIYGVGHSNGAMMTQTMMCLTGIYAKGAALSGPLMAEVSSCPAARGHTIYAYHGSDDANVPVAGGYGTKGVTDVYYVSEAQSKTMFENSGGTYVLQILQGADHQIEHLNDVSKQQTGQSIAQRVAHDLGLAP